MMRFSRALLILPLALSAGGAFPCTPPPQAYNEAPQLAVKRRYNSTKHVVIARLKTTENIALTQGSSFAVPGERNVFRVTRVFKGNFRVGDTFVITTVLGGCGRSVRNYDQAISESGRPTGLQLDWLIYMNAPRDTQIVMTPYTRPLNLAFDDVTHLQELQSSSDRRKR